MHHKLNMHCVRANVRRNRHKEEETESNQNVQKNEKFELLTLEYSQNKISERNLKVKYGPVE